VQPNRYQLHIRYKKGSMHPLKGGGGAEFPTLCLKGPYNVQAKWRTWPYFHFGQHPPTPPPSRARPRPPRRAPERPKIDAVYQTRPKDWHDRSLANLPNLGGNDLS
jgi:hypothetical protein